MGKVVYLNVFLIAVDFLHGDVLGRASALRGSPPPSQGAKALKSVIQRETRPVGTGRVS